MRTCHSSHGNIRCPPFTLDSAGASNLTKFLTCCKRLQLLALRQESSPAASAGSSISRQRERDRVFEHETLSAAQPTKTPDKLVRVEGRDRTVLVGPPHAVVHRDG